jgi:hypothetical protein
MKRKFAALAVLAAAVAVILPASSMGSMFPAGHKFTIAGGSKLSTSLGSCTLGPISATIPASPANQEAFVQAPASTPTASCGAGTTIAITGSWTFGNATEAGGNLSIAQLKPTTSESLVMRFSSLPGCKLKMGTGPFYGVWSNGYSFRPMMSSFHADRAIPLVWANDGSSSCAVAGQTETVSFEDHTVIGGLVTNPVTHTVTDNTSPGTIVILSN